MELGGVLSIQRRLKSNLQNDTLEPTEEMGQEMQSELEILTEQIGDCEDVQPERWQSDRLVLVEIISDFKSDFNAWEVLKVLKKESRLWKKP